MENLLEAINEYYHSEGEYPTVKVREAWFRLHYLEFVGLMRKLVVEIDNNLKSDWRLV